MKRVIGIGEMFVSDDPADVITTYALGSCLGIAIYDPVVRVGGLLHAMLPDSTVDPEKARERPLMFVDTGVPMLFRACYALGAMKPRIEVKVAGGASVNNLSSSDMFQIGKRNFLMLRKLLWKNGVLITSQDVGGSASRTMSINISDGVVIVRSNGKEKFL